MKLFVKLKEVVLKQVNSELDRYDEIVALSQKEKKILKSEHFLLFVGKYKCIRLLILKVFIKTHFKYIYIYF